MDYQWFDELTRAIAPVSRRASFKILGASLASRVVPALGIGVSVLPARAAADARPTNPDTTLATVELLPYQDSGYRFQTSPLGAATPVGWEQRGFDASAFQLGRGAFGSGGDCPLQSTVRTIWPINSELLVRTVVSVPARATDLRIMVSVDNDIVGVFFNGLPLTRFNSHDDCPIQDEFRFDVPPSLATPGDKLVAFHVLNRGGEAFFDARILAELPTQYFAAAQPCVDTNTIPASMTSNQFLDYIARCGVKCPDGRHEPGQGGCTIPHVNYSYTYPSPTPGTNDRGQRCLSTVVTAEWTLDQNTEMIDYNPTACCNADCQEELGRYKRELAAHEAGHRQNCQDAVDAAKVDWKDNPNGGHTIIVCRGRRNLRDATNGLLFPSDVTNGFGLSLPAAPSAALARALEDELKVEIEKQLQDRKGVIIKVCEAHPPQPGEINCQKCVEAKPGRRCVNGRCLEGPCSASSTCPNARDCSQGGKQCQCLTTTEGDIRCGGLTAGLVNFCAGAISCVTSNDCSALGEGWFCQEAGTGCCGCMMLNGRFFGCPNNRVCVPPC